MLLLHQVWSYFQLFPEDRLWTKALVGTLAMLCLGMTMVSSELSKAFFQAITFSLADSHACASVPVSCSFLFALNKKGGERWMLKCPQTPQSYVYITFSINYGNYVRLWKSISQLSSLVL